LRETCGQADGGVKFAAPTATWLVGEVILLGGCGTLSE